MLIILAEWHAKDHTPKIIKLFYFDFNLNVVACKLIVSKNLMNFGHVKK